MSVVQPGGVMKAFDDLREQVHSYPTPVPYIWVPKGRGKMDAITYRVMNHMIRCNKVKLWHKINEAVSDMILYGKHTRMVG